MSITDSQKQIFEDAWLGLGDLSSIKILQNSMIHRTENEIENPDLHLIRLLRDPKYLGSTCKLLFNIELHPMQVVILQEFWYRPFPMYIASRGWGKSFLLALYSVLRCVFFPGTKIVIVGAAFRQSKIIFEYMETIWRSSPILRSIFNGNDDGPRRDVDRCTIRLGDSWTIAVPMGDGCVIESTMITTERGFSTIKRDSQNDKIWGNGKFNISDEFYDNGIRPVKQITTKKKFSYTATHNHHMKICRNGIIEWVRTDEMKVGDRILIDRTFRWHNGSFQCSDDQAYALGSMIGDGCWTDQYKLGFATSDQEHFKPILNKVFNYQWKDSDKYHYLLYSKKIVSDWLAFWNMPVSKALNKTLPPNILSASRTSMSACLSGIFDTDGGVQVNTGKGGTSITVSLYNTSEILIRQIQYILLHYGIVSAVRSRPKRKETWNKEFSIKITGKNVKLFHQHIGFRLPRKNKILTNAILNQIRNISSEDTIPDIKQLLIDIATQYSSKNSPGCVLSKIVDRKNITREFLAKFIIAYEHSNDPRLTSIAEHINPNIYYDTITDISNVIDQPTYDMHVPIVHEYCANGFYSHNSKIRGLRAHIIIADEFASISSDIYETVVAGFAAVSASPIQNVKEQAKKKAMIEAGIWNTELEQLNYKMGNQAIISGTADYAFKHFASYWRRYKSIIESGGDTRKLEELFNGEVPENFNWKDYSIIRIPYELIPKGFMDDKQVARARATVHTGIYNMEYAACFTSDSQGFFRRSLIEGCVVGDNPPIIINNQQILFDVTTVGNPNCQYVYGIDPASERDNFSIIVLELHKDHSRIVYCWTTNRSNFKERQKTGMVSDHDFYGFCTRKIRNLMKTFPPIKIGLDAQGGGVAIEESFHDPSKLEEGETLIWPIIDYAKPKDTDDQAGQHILELVQFAKADWTSQANHGLRKDLEDKTLLFPRFDQLTLGLALDKEGKDILGSDLTPLYDNLSECILEIEELKNELTTIVMTQTSTGSGGRDRWDTPEVKLQNGKKGRLRKDRYSALVIANMIARQLKTYLVKPDYDVIGGNRQEIVSQQDGEMYKGPQWFVSGANDDIYNGIYR